MDPSRELCNRNYSFQTFPLEIDDETINNLFMNLGSLEERHNLALSIISEIVANIARGTSEMNYNRALLENEEIANKYQELSLLKDKLSTIGDNFDKARKLANPYEKIGRSIFLNRAAIKLANTDAVFNLTKSETSFFSPISTKTTKLVANGMREEDYFTFVDIAGGPGGFTEYIQYRFPMSIGYGITLLSELPYLNWDIDRLKMDRFIPIVGEDGTGNLYTNWSYFIFDVITSTPEGVKLAVADGGFDTDDPQFFQHQEFMSARLIMIEILIACRISAEGASFVLKVFDTVTDISIKLIWIISLFYENVSIFKPVSSRPANAERYVVATGFIGIDNIVYRELEPILKYLENTADDLVKQDIETGESTFLADIFPSLDLGKLTKLIYGIKETMIWSIGNQYQAVSDILDYGQALNQGDIVKANINNFNYDRFLLIWNLPSNFIPKFYPRYLPASEDNLKNKIEFAVASKLDPLSILEIAYGRSISVDRSDYRKTIPRNDEIILDSTRVKYLEQYNLDNIQQLLDIYKNMYLINLHVSILKKYDNSIIEMFSSPISASFNRKYCSALPLDIEYGSKGSIFDYRVFDSYQDYLVFLPPSIYLMDKLDNLLQKVHKLKGNITVYAPYWPDFNLIQKLKVTGNAVKYKRISLHNYATGEDLKSNMEYIKSTIPPNFNYAALNVV